MTRSKNYVHKISAASVRRREAAQKEAAQKQASEQAFNEAVAKEVERRMQHQFAKRKQQIASDATIEYVEPIEKQT